MSYENPQAPNSNNALSGIISKAGEASRAESLRQEKVNRANITSLAQGFVNSITPKKNALKEFTKSQKNQQQDLYDAISSTDLGYKDFDASSDKMMHGLIDDFSTIQGHLNNGTMVDEQLGRRDLAKIKNKVNTYAAAIPRFKAITSAITKASEDPNSPQLSITGPPVDQMEIITKITNGKKVNIIQNGDSIILEDPDTGSILNVAEFNKAFDDPKSPYLVYEADVTEPLKDAFTSYMKDDEGSFTANFTTPEIRKDRNNNDVEITTMTVEQQQQLKNAMIGVENKSTGVPDGQFTALIAEEGESIWEDIMDGGRGYDEFTKEKGEALEWFAGKNSIPAPDDPEFELYKRQYDVMLDYLSTRALQDNAASEGIELLTETVKPKVVNGEEVITQKEFNKQWNSLKPGEKLTGPNGVEYTKLR